MEVQKFLISEKSSMIEAMQQLDKVAKKVLFVERDEKLVASITDGDIRRWILRKGNLDASVSEIANYNPKYLYEKDKFTSKEFMKKNSIEAIPLLNNENKIVSIVFTNEGVIQPNKILSVPVVIMAGGFGKRLYPYTKILPKPLIPIGEIPIVEHIMNRFNRYGSNQFFLVVNHKKNMIKAYFNETEKEYSISYVDEDKPLGTGGGLSLLKGKINSTFILSNCDILIDEDYERIYNFHKNEKNLITMVCSLKSIRIPYGVIEINETGEIIGMKEKPELKFFTNTGMYIVEARIIEEAKFSVEISFPDIIEHYKSLGEKIGIYPISEYNWMDMGQLDEMEEMRKRLENNE